MSDIITQNLIVTPGITNLIICEKMKSKHNNLNIFSFIY